jgi:SPP1 family predicted phage head-tail adaptor
MKAGSLNTRITIQEQSTTQDALGQPVNTWTDFANCWADVRQISGMSAIKSGADVSTIRASIRIRRNANITAHMRVVIGLVTYNIEAVLDDISGHQYSDLICKVIQ